MKIITSKGLWVSSSFTEKFGSDDITPAKTVPQFKKLERPMTDLEIKNELGATECTLEDVAALLKNPPKGTNDGNWNLFYVSGFVVSVYWSADYGEWGVNDWDLDDDHWSAGRRVFSRNWNLEPLPSDLGSLESLTFRVTELEAWKVKVEKWAAQLAPPEL